MGVLYIAKKPNPIIDQHSGKYKLSFYMEYAVRFEPEICAGF
jgi:hypothetical protein